VHLKHTNYINKQTTNMRIAAIILTSFLVVSIIFILSYAMAGITPRMPATR